jgi:hypothetical protein
VHSVPISLENLRGLGPITGFDPLQDQQQRIFPSIDLDLGPKWEPNFGVAAAWTGAADHWVVKCIPGRRFTRGRKEQN